MKIIHQLAAAIGLLLAVGVVASAQGVGERQNMDRLLDTKIQDSDVLHNAITPGNAIAFILATNHIPGGIVEAESCDTQESIWMQKRPFNVAGWTVRQALDLILAGQSDYKWVVTGNVVNVLPKHGLPALLTVKLEHFETKGIATNLDIEDRLFNAESMKTFIAQHHFTPEDRLITVIGSNSEPIGRPLSVGNTPTPLEVLNAAADAYEGHAVWRYTEHNGHCNPTYFVDWPAL